MVIGVGRRLGGGEDVVVRAPEVLDGVEGGDGLQVVEPAGAMSEASRKGGDVYDVKTVLAAELASRRCMSHFQGARILVSSS